MIAEGNESWKAEIPPIILAAKFGIAAAFGLMFSCTSYFFESKFMGTVFGIMNTIARAITILAPLVAEANYPTPVLSLILSCIVAVILTRILKEPTKQRKAIID